MIKWSAIAVMALSVVHLATLGIDASAYASAWATFGLWSTEHLLPLADQSPTMVASNAAFWMTMGSMAVPAFLLGYLILRLDQSGVIIPVEIGWVFLVWQVACALIMQPSGFIVSVVIAIALLVGLRRQSGRAASTR